MGRLRWNIQPNICGDDKSERELFLTNCIKKFACHNGYCIDLDKRWQKVARKQNITFFRIWSGVMETPTAGTLLMNSTAKLYTGQRKKHIQRRSHHRQQMNGMETQIQQKVIRIDNEPYIVKIIIFNFGLSLPWVWLYCSGYGFSVGVK